jgi:hypothetical protein
MMLDEGSAVRRPLEGCGSLIVMVYHGILLRYRVRSYMVATRSLPQEAGRIFFRFLRPQGSV